MQTNKYAIEKRIVRSWDELDEAVNKLPLSERRTIRQYIKEYMLAEDKKRAGKILIRKLENHNIIVDKMLERDIIEGNI